MLSKRIIHKTPCDVDSIYVKYTEKARVGKHSKFVAGLQMEMKTR